MSKATKPSTKKPASPGSKKSDGAASNTEDLTIEELGQVTGGTGGKPPVSHDGDTFGYGGLGSRKVPTTGH